MSDKLKNLLEAAMMLDEVERAELAGFLIGSLQDSEVAADPTIEAAWKEELERRWQAYQHGEMETVPLEDVLTKLRSGTGQSMPDF